MESEPKQLKLIKSETSGSDAGGNRRDKKEKEHKANMWFVFIILVLSVAVTLIFYLSGSGQIKRDGDAKQIETDGGWLGEPKVYEF